MEAELNAKGDRLGTTEADLVATRRRLALLEATLARSEPPRSFSKKKQTALQATPSMNEAWSQTSLQMEKELPQAGIHGRRIYARVATTMIRRACQAVWWR